MLLIKRLVRIKWNLNKRRLCTFDELKCNSSQQLCPVVSIRRILEVTLPLICLACIQVIDRLLDATHHLSPIAPDMIAITNHLSSIRSPVSHHLHPSLPTRHLSLVIIPCPSLITYIKSPIRYLICYHLTSSTN